MITKKSKTKLTEYYENYLEKDENIYDVFKPMSGISDSGFYPIVSIQDEGDQLCGYNALQYSHLLGKFSILSDEKVLHSSIRVDHKKSYISKHTRHLRND